MQSPKKPVAEDKVAVNEGYTDCFKCRVIGSTVCAATSAVFALQVFFNTHVINFMYLCVIILAVSELNNYE